MKLLWSFDLSLTRHGYWWWFGVCKYFQINKKASSQDSWCWRLIVSGKPRCLSHKNQVEFNRGYWILISLLVLSIILVHTWLFVWFMVAALPFSHQCPQKILMWMINYSVCWLVMSQIWTLMCRSLIWATLLLWICHEQATSILG